MKRSRMVTVLFATLVFGWFNACGGTVQEQCSSESDQAMCARLSRNCDLLTAVDTCGRSRTVNCGTCTAPETCGGGGTTNQCGSADSQTSHPGADASLPDASAPDACTFACPTRTHSITATLHITNATVADSSAKTFGKLAGLKDETFDIVLSFEEKQITKQPSQGDSYVTQIAIDSMDVVSHGDASGQFDAVVKPAINSAPPWFAEFTYSPNAESVRFHIRTGDFTRRYILDCRVDVKGVPVGIDHYAIPGPFASARGLTGIEYEGTSGGDYAGGDVTVSYR